MTKNYNLSAYQELTANISNMNAIGIGDAAAAAILLKMRDGDPSDTDAHQLRAALYMQFRHGDMAYFMHERGVIDEVRLRSTLRPLPLSGATGIAFWNQNKFVFVENYQQYVDSLIQQGFWK